MEIRHGFGLIQNDVSAKHLHEPAHDDVRAVFVAVDFVLRVVALVKLELVVMQVGKEGIGEKLVESLSDALEARELIKINLLPSSGDDGFALAEELAKLLRAPFYFANFSYRKALTRNRIRRRRRSRYRPPYSPCSFKPFLNPFQTGRIGQARRVFF